MSRCSWAEGSDAEQDYHDCEWGVPLHDDQRLFEFLILEGAQAGLSWSTVLNKREGYRELYQGFDPQVVADFDEATIESLLSNPAIVRNKLKVYGSVKNARAFVDIQQRYGSFDQYIWQFIGGCPKQNCWSSVDQVPASTVESEQMSKALKKAGFTFVGPTICYAFMQATGMVNDHIESCFRYRETRALSE
ncbi:DNA-3-methyladenine glycosylase [Motiliproteus sp. MSK22-1]|nr:DNA-3-methyladenine glycosylase [Motiliproteus sp. MSK22-1]